MKKSLGCGFGGKIGRQILIEKYNHPREGIAPEARLQTSSAAI
jgi:hypothetical protein